MCIQRCCARLLVEKAFEEIRTETPKHLQSDAWTISGPPRHPAIRNVCFTSFATSPKSLKCANSGRPPTMWRGAFPDSMTRGSIWLQAARRPLGWLRPLNSIFLDHYATSLADICAILLRICWARHGGNAKDRGDPGCGHRRLQPARRRRRGAHTRAPPAPAQRSDRPTPSPRNRGRIVKRTGDIRGRLPARRPVA